MLCTGIGITTLITASTTTFISTPRIKSTAVAPCVLRKLKIRAAERKTGGLLLVTTRFPM
jgi:hypothetical protein